MTATVQPDQRWTSAYPHLTGEPVPIAGNADPAQFELEREKIFRRSWLNVALVEEVPGPNDYIVREIAILNTSVIIVRGKDGQLRAFHNMCSHRGNRVMLRDKGNCRGALTCILHGWTFNTEGALVYAQGEDRIVGFQRGDHGLTPVHLDVWEGIVFLNFSEKPEQTLAEFLAPVSERIRGYPFAQMHPIYRYVADEKTNWKTAVQSQIEGWHVADLHRNSFARDIIGGAAAFEPPLLACYGPHSYNSVRAPEAAGKPLPIAERAARFGRANVWHDLRLQQSPDEVAGWRHNDLNNYFIWPNTILSMMDTNYLLFRFWPISVERTLWEFHGMGIDPPAHTAGDRFAQQYRDALQRQIFCEDVFVHTAVQSNLRSGAKSHFLFQDLELTLRHFDYTVREWLARQ